MDVFTYIIAFTAGCLFAAIVLTVGRVNRERDDYERGYIAGIKHAAKQHKDIYNRLPDINDIKLQ